MGEKIIDMTNDERTWKLTKWCENERASGRMDVQREKLINKLTNETQERILNVNKNEAMNVNKNEAMNENKNEAMNVNKNEAK